MADILADEVFDDGLNALLTAENLYICDTQPTTFTEASVTYMLGYKASPGLTGPGEGGAGGGRQMEIDAITDGVVDAAGDAAWFALCDDSESLLLVSGNLGAVLSIALGSPWTLDAVVIQLPDPTA